MCRIKTRIGLCDGLSPLSQPIQMRWRWALLSLAGRASARGFRSTAAVCASYSCLRHGLRADRTPRLSPGTRRPQCAEAYLIKLSGLNKKMYQSCLKSFECLLDMNSNIGIKDLAVQFSCTEAVNMASKILQSYESSLPQTPQVDLDLSRPLFTTAALLSACKILKLKVDKNKMVAMAGVKKSIFDRLCKQLEKTGQQIDKGRDLARPLRKKKRTVIESLAEEIKKVEEIPHKRQKDEDVTQDYEEWKRKILENATSAQKTTAE
ncbi:PREDICTED: origin recognition complex subunit 6 isoform X2 [Chinchilla lanigera]|uniref:origin recognition complex subunit 6 isoform X2 n=1 Tax=Chinchilla lanigera TaxID=34839 RepID=UPI00038E99D6|nr:PREDICTED: origin recognition complex subunit 6 isoform X2 [Chinchilla lanigera]